MLSPKTSDARRLVQVACCCVCILCACAAAADDIPRTGETSLLDQGYYGLYNLDFTGAQKDFVRWQQQHPDNPVGPVSEAAGFLFSEFNRLGVLESQFYENDSSFEHRSKMKADPAIRTQFEDAIARSENLAHARLAKNNNDQDALFAMTLSSGLQADYAALIDKENLESLHLTKQASAFGQRLLSVCHNCYDALLATGFSKYITGTMAAPVRWLLRLGGISPDKQGGIEDLQITATQGHYLAPFARILLAIAYVREKNKPRALELLTQLRSEFPANPLFSREISRLQSRQ
jgi:hypothetical protein